MQVTEQQTVAEIAANSIAAVRVFEKYGIDYCCGGKRPLAEVCRAKGFDTAQIQRELDAALAGGDTPAQDWNVAPLAELAAHVVTTHHEYLRRELPAIQARLDKVYRVYNQRYGPTLIGLPEVFAALRAELESHIQKEERTIFPAIVTESPFVEDLIRGAESEHEIAGQALARVREITGDFSLPDYACVTYKALMTSMHELESDTHVHIHLENTVLFPRALQRSSAHVVYEPTAG